MIFESRLYKGMPYRERKNIIKEHCCNKIICILHNKFGLYCSENLGKASHGSKAMVNYQMTS